MARARTLTTILAGLAVTATASACSSSGGSGAPIPPLTTSAAPTTSAAATTSAAPPTPPATSSSAPSTSAGPDPATEAAYQAYHATVHIVNDQESAISALQQHAWNDQLSAAQADARQFRNALFNWDAAVRQVSFPPAVQPSVNALLDGTRTEIIDFDAIGTATATNLTSVAETALVADGKDVLANDKLEAALGHPADAAGLTADQFTLAAARVDLTTARASSQFRRAIGTGSLPLALQANENVYNGFANFQTQLGSFDVAPSAQSSVATLTRATQNVVAFLQQRQNATSLSTFGVDGSPGTLVTTWEQARAQAAQALYSAAGS